MIKPDAWLVPQIVSFKNALRHDCPADAMADIEGTVAWGAQVFCDSQALARIDKDGHLHFPLPLFKHPADELFTAIAHGDSEHRAWLFEALHAFFDGQPVPPARPAAVPVSRMPEMNLTMADIASMFDEGRQADMVLAVANLQARVHKLAKLDSESANHVECVICMRTHFTGNPPYVGWKGLGLALTEALDERDKLRNETKALWRYANLNYDGKPNPQCKECMGSAVPNAVQCPYHILLATLGISE